MKLGVRAGCRPLSSPRGLTALQQSYGCSDAMVTQAPVTVGLKTLHTQGYLNVSKQLGRGCKSILGEEILFELADWPLHACVLVILLVLLLNCHICEMHVQILQIGFVQGIS